MDILNMNSFMRFPIAGRSDHARADPGAVLLLQRPGDPLGALPAERDARPAHQVDAHVHPRTGMTVGLQWHLVQDTTLEVGHARSASMSQGRALWKNPRH